SRKGQPTARIDLGPAVRVEQAVRRWRVALTAGRAGHAQGAALHRLIWSPLEEHLGRARAVIISPDGALAGVPCCALPGGKEGTYLIEDVALATAAVPQLLPEMLRPIDGKTRLGPSLLAVGGVDYGGAPGGRLRWGRLPGTAAEAAAVSKAFAGL